MGMSPAIRMMTVLLITRFATMEIVLPAVNVNTVMGELTGHAVRAGMVIPLEREVIVQIPLRLRLGMRTKEMSTNTDYPSDTTDMAKTTTDIPLQLRTTNTTQTTDRETIHTQTQEMEWENTIPLRLRTADTMTTTEIRMTTTKIRMTTTEIRMTTTEIRMTTTKIRMATTTTTTNGRWRWVHLIPMVFGMWKNR